jgi:hypothetical protein
MFIAVGTRRRRAILATLNNETAPLSEQELALTLARSEEKVPGADIPPEKAQEIRTNLYHTHLPLLEDSGLISWNREEGSITTTDHAAFEDSQFQRLLETKSDGVDEALSGLSNTHRRLLIAILRDAQTPISKTTLARETLQLEQSDTEPTQEAMNELLVALSHIHLPKLDDTNIIEYNPETERIAYTKHSGLEELITLIQRPDSRVVERLDEFLGGLLTAYTTASKNTDDPFGWPTSWSDSSHS